MGNAGQQVGRKSSKNHPDCYQILIEVYIKLDRCQMGMFNACIDKCLGLHECCWTRRQRVGTQAGNCENVLLWAKAKNFRQKSEVTVITYHLLTYRRVCSLTSQAVTRLTSRWGGTGAVIGR